MNTALSWIKAYVPGLEVDDQEYCDAMTLSGTKVEGFEKLDKNLDKKSSNLIIFHLGKDFEFASKFEFDNVIKIGSNQDADIVCASSYHRDGHTLNIDEKLRFSKGAFEPISPKICDIVSELMGKRVEFDINILKAFA